MKHRIGRIWNGIKPVRRSWHTSRFRIQFMNFFDSLLTHAQVLLGKGKFIKNRELEKTPGNCRAFWLQDNVSQPDLLVAFLNARRKHAR